MYEYSYIAANHFVYVFQFQGVYSAFAATVSRAINAYCLNASNFQICCDTSLTSFRKHPSAQYEYCQPNDVVMANAPIQVLYSAHQVLFTPTPTTTHEEDVVSSNRYLSAATICRRR